MMAIIGESDASKAFLEFFGLRPPTRNIEKLAKNRTRVIAFFSLQRIFWNVIDFCISSHTLQTHLIVPNQSFAFVAVVTLGGRVIVPGHEQREAEQRALTTNSEELRTLMEK
ncbi:hypothetical protein TNCV_3450151 [Trichonephila clavipes]|uniref:Uncharacterized protein n=1 Tax=Trichonephila clavipes TaxID=2585209 RepID=A0A8X6WKS6_TRICX|nr:hypothetical protein TNCV_3450151 [Trichonephila clavipes]